MQNLTAHYNILFNAREILKKKQVDYALASVDNYSEILSVYQDTSAAAGEDKDLEAVIAKANTIINFKEQSKYLGDAYLALGKAYYLGKNYFNAQEYFNYVLRSYNINPELVQEALVWKARTLMQLKQIPEAKLVLDTALQNINPKKSITADVYATKLQYDIYEQEYPDAEEMAKLAIEHSKSTMQKLRWTFILGQLQELNLKPADAVVSYTRIVKSNAPFEMAFNADLNRIRIEDMRDGIKISRIEKLKNMLRNQNNEEFVDQIYYQIAQLYFAEGNIDDAIENYKLSTRHSLKNQNQKGLSYLRLADINFKNKADYVSAKKYYDSTLLNLSPTYPGYITIKNKSDNLQLLTDNLDIISREDTLQMLARLDDKARSARIDTMVSRQIAQQSQQQVQQQQAGFDKSGIPTVAGTDNVPDPQASTPTGNNFYFYNNRAVSQGFTVFKRKWGNRKLEDNWRRSQRTNSNITANSAPATDAGIVPGQVQQAQADTAANAYRQQLVASIPLTPENLEQSNTRIFNAYFDIGNFYRDIVEDPKEAIATYEQALARFPNNPNKAAIYYSLYRLYTPIDVAKAESYKNRLLSEFADTPYAKVILDPEYGQRLNDADAEFNALYNQVYELYAKRQYSQVIEQVTGLLQQYPDNKLAAQLNYLRALANGRQVKLTPFKEDIQQIAAQYPEDRLITPLVKLHLAYIDSNNVEMAARPFAIIDSDPDYIPFLPEDVAPLQPRFAQVAEKRIEKPKPAETPKPVEKPKAAPVESKPSEPVIAKQTEIQPKQEVPAEVIQTPEAPAETATVEPAKPKKTYIFNESDNTNYYFVVNVNTNTTNLASSRFGIGQFNRTRYQGLPIKHQVKGVGINQLIYVGRFNSLAEVKDYARAIIPLMPEIMKVPKDKYAFFIITQQNLDKLADKTLLDSYTEYYQDNF
nr:tetratricopeptide repeat protein [Mucilaginibacter hurinus]